MNNKVLFVSTIPGFINRFLLPYLKWFKDHGYIVHVAYGGKMVDILYTDQHILVPIERSPFRISNIRAYWQLKQIIERENYSLIHCHTPMGGVIGRLAAKKARLTMNVKVMYTAHGFHFFKGAPFYYWLTYYTMEWYLAHYTDALVTMNSEDYQLIQAHAFKSVANYMIPGIGINTERLVVSILERKVELRKEYGYNIEFILIYIAEFIPRKNHKFFIDSLPDLVQKVPRVKMLFVGSGQLLEQMKRYAEEKHVSRYIDFLGYRSDVGALIALSDVGISASYHEGLPMNISEEMYCGLPVIASEVRGHTDIVLNGKNGYLYTINDRREFISKVYMLSSNEELRMKLSKQAKTGIQKYTIGNALKEMEKIYNKYLSFY